ncbi:hypothetical protein HY029_02895, partial [Candidatus Gottesmanbacteria bacterium]|nr:hypothetical protein [Candidatus Gottesmanbacteria bacterium]
SKPAIYLYPQKETSVTVKLHPEGFLTLSDPPYNSEKGWQVIAYPDGTIQTTDNKQQITKYPYLYYEARLEKIPVVTSGFVIKKSDLTSFLPDKLHSLGLNNREIQDYMEYWLPRLNNISENYLLIYFMNKNQIDTIEPLDIDMKIDSEIRIRTYFKPLISPIDIKQQNLEPPPVRNGNALVEWGGILDKQ